MPKPKRNKISGNSPLARSKEKLSDIDTNSELVKFSFKYLSSSNSKFLFNQHDGSYFLKLIERLKAISAMSINEFRQNGSKALRAHRIDWDKTTEAGGFGIANEDQLVSEPYQFALSSNEYGRVHGFLIQNRFYIVWLDKAHLLYS